MGFNLPQLGGDLTCIMGGAFRCEFAPDSGNAREICLYDGDGNLLSQANSSTAGPNQFGVPTIQFGAQGQPALVTIWELAGTTWFQCQRYPDDGANHNSPQFRKNNLANQVSATIFPE